MPVTPRQWIEQGSCVGFVGRRYFPTDFKFLCCGIADSGDLLRFVIDCAPLLGPPIGAAPKEVIETPPGVSALGWGPAVCLAGGTGVGYDLVGGGGPVVGAPGRVMRVPLGRLGICAFFTLLIPMASGGIGGAGAVSGSPSTMITSLSPADPAPAFSCT